MEKILEQQILDDITLFKFNQVKGFNVTLADQVKSEIFSCISSGCKKIIFNLQDVSFIDSSGFGALVSIYSFAKENEAKFKICNISKEAMGLVIVTKLDNVFEIYNSVNESVDSF